jgi:signal transduction histidine kinase/DNA-binding response OmpR family regulator
MSVGTSELESVPPLASAAANVVATAPSHAIRVLLVDDTERNLAALEAMLGDLDATLVTARSGEEALRRLLEGDYALILLDIRMPGLDGFETAALIRSRDRSRHTPIIFLTAFDGNRDQELRGYALGAVDFLSKPVVPEVLRGKVGALIELARKTDELERQSALLREAERRDHVQRLEMERRAWHEEALRRERDYERAAAASLQRANARLDAIAQAASELLRVTDPFNAATRLFLGAARLGADVGLWYAGDDAPSLAAWHGLDGPPPDDVRRPRPDDPLVARAARERRAVLLDVHGDAGVAPAVRARSAAAYPLVAGGRVHGVLAFATRGAAIERDDLAALSAIADHVSAALERARLVTELSRVAADLRDADARKDQFLAMLGHELRNPLAPVLNAVKLVERQEADHPELLRVVAAADRQIGHMTRLLDDLLDVSRIRNGKIELRRARVDLRDVLRDAVHAQEALVIERRHALAVELPADPLVVDGDPVRLTQIAGNLLHNAAKYTDPGGHLALSARREGDRAVFTVGDDGIGIDRGMLPRVFDMFVQAEQGSDRAHGGLGLGLTLVKNLVEMHGGDVEARSQGLGHGSDFEVRLPLVAAPADDAIAARSPCAPRDGATAAVRPLHIVLVEDNADIRDSLRALLELCGHSVEEAEDGRQGIALVRERAPDVALIDIGLPGLDGYEVARQLRGGPATRLIAMTGYGRPEDRRLALDAGFHAHLVKPVNFDDLSNLLASLP